MRLQVTFPPELIPMDLQQGKRLKITTALAAACWTYLGNCWLFRGVVVSVITAPSVSLLSELYSFYIFCPVSNGTESWMLTRELNLHSLGSLIGGRTKQAEDPPTFHATHSHCAACFWTCVSFHPHSYRDSSSCLCAHVITLDNAVWRSYLCYRTSPV